MKMLTPNLFSARKDPLRIIFNYFLVTAIIPNGNKNPRKKEGGKEK